MLRTSRSTCVDRFSSNCIKESGACHLHCTSIEYLFSVVWTPGTLPGGSKLQEYTVLDWTAIKGSRQESSCPAGKWTVGQLERIGACYWLRRAGRPAGWPVQQVLQARTHEPSCHAVAAHAGPPASSAAEGLHTAPAKSALTCPLSMSFTATRSPVLSSVNSLVCAKLPRPSSPTWQWRKQTGNLSAGAAALAGHTTLALCMAYARACRGLVSVPGWGPVRPSGGIPLRLFTHQAVPWVLGVFKFVVV